MRTFGRVVSTNDAATARGFDFHSSAWSAERDALTARAVAAGGIERDARHGIGNPTCDPHVEFPGLDAAEEFLRSEGILDQPE